MGRSTVRRLEEIFGFEVNQEFFVVRVENLAPTLLSQEAGHARVE